MKLVILESPFAAKTFIGRWLNRRYARACAKDCLNRGEAPFASHLLYTQKGILRDYVLAERKLGIEAGLAWGEKSVKTVVYVDRGVSPGMALGIENAKKHSRPIEYRKLNPLEAYEGHPW